MVDDIKVKIGADVSGVEKALDKISKKKMNIPFLKTGFTKSESYKSAKQTLESLKTYRPTSSAYQSQKGTGTLDTGMGKKTLSEAFRIGFTQVSKKNKMELWWKWLKGTYNLMAKYSPLLKSFADLFSAAMGLIMTALLLPFLDDILGALKFLLEKSADFFKWMKTNKDKVRDVAQIGFDAILAGLGLSGIVKVFTWLGEHILPKLIPGFKILSAILEPVITWLGEKGLWGVLKGVVAWVAKFIDPLLWATLIAEIGKYIFDWIKGWSDNPIWQSFWGGMAQLAGIVSELTDVIGWVIDIFTGKGWDRVSRIGEEIVGFGNNIKKTLGVTGSLASGDLSFGAKAPISTPTAATTGGGQTNIQVSGLVDEQKFRAIIKEEVNRSNKGIYNVRGSVGI